MLIKKYNTASLSATRHNARLLTGIRDCINVDRKTFYVVNEQEHIGIAVDDEIYPVVKLTDDSTQRTTLKEFRIPRPSGVR